MAAALTVQAEAPDASQAVVRHRGEEVVRFSGHVRGGYVIVEADLARGWHLYAMDNLERARARSGKENPDCELPTRIAVSGPVEITGAWRQSEPTDRSNEDIFWYTWGYEERAVFAAPVKRTSEGAGEVVVTINGQACTDSSCSMVEDVTLTLGADAIAGLGEGSFDYEGMSALVTSAAN